MPEAIRAPDFLRHILLDNVPDRSAQKRKDENCDVTLKACA
jgi:hypothetical protein